MKFWDSSALRLRGAATLEGFRVLPYSEEVNEARVEYMAV